MLYCEVAFPGTTKLYGYATFYTDLEVGDTVLVQANNSITVAMFAHYISQPNYQCKMVVGHIDETERSKYA